MTDNSTQKASESTKEKQQHPEDDRIVDPRDLVYSSSYSEEGGSISEDPREIVSNPGVTPEMLDTTSQDLRSDIFREPSEE